MKELDVLLTRWLDRRWAAASEDERRAFECLLEQPDPQLLAWLFRRERPVDPCIAAIVDDLLGPQR
jgi:antitoxin CptB